MDYIIEPRTKKLQQFGLEILIAFHEICEENQLTYVLDFGTLLGAVRHEGFIPWDDDVDVAMPREDFEKFKQLASSSLPKHMFLQTHDTDPNYYNCIAKIRIPSNQYIEQAMQYFDIVHGPWLDIFIYDYTFDEVELEQKKQEIYNRKRSFYPWMIETLVSKPLNDSSFFEKIVPSGFKALLIQSQKCKRRNFFMRFLDNKYDQLTKVFKETPKTNSSGEMLTYTFPIQSEADEKALRLTYKQFQKRKLQKFEEYFFYIPVDYEQILTDRYGNYMQLPPYHERKANHSWVN